MQFSRRVWRSARGEPLAGERGRRDRAGMNRAAVLVVLLAVGAGAAALTLCMWEHGGPGSSPDAAASAGSASDVRDLRDLRVARDASGANALLSAANAS